MVLIGLGAGLGFPSLMVLAMSGATESDSGLASGLVNTSVQVGGAIGLAVLATLATERTDARLDDGVSGPAALNSGYHLAYLIGAGLVLVAIAVAVSFLREGAPEATPAEVPEVPAEAPAIRVKPLPAFVAGGGCQEAGMRVVIGCGGCAGSAP
jgi:MFS family permease